MLSMEKKHETTVLCFSLHFVRCSSCVSFWDVLNITNTYNFIWKHRHFKFHFISDWAGFRYLPVHCNIESCQRIPLRRHQQPVLAEIERLPVHWSVTQLVKTFKTIFLQSYILHGSEHDRNRKQIRMSTTVCSVFCQLAQKWHWEDML